jgi:putative FmdB family regulatory protein
MPIYAYRCSTCGHAKDVLQKMSDPLLTVCPECGASTFVKQVTAAGFQLKGSGWYVTDFRGGDKGAPAKADSGKDEAGKGESSKADAGKGEGGKADSAPSDSAASSKSESAPSPAAPSPSPAPASTPSTPSSNTK